MNRLTRKSDISDMVWFIDREHKSGYVEREPCEMDAHHARLAIARLAEYEGLEEQGKLLKLPCAVGDTVYRPYINTVIEMKVVSIVAQHIIQIYYSGTSYRSVIEDFGKTVFLTREEAEAELKELKSKEIRK